MAERDGAAVGIDVLGIVRKAELTQDRQGLRGERLVQLDDIQLLDIQPARAPAPCGSPEPDPFP